MSKKRILVTGAAGFIGSSVANRLLLSDAEVIGLDCINDYYNPKWKQENVAELKEHSNFQFIKDDILNENSLQKLFNDQQFNAVIHLAARAGVRPSINDPKLYEEVNVRGTLNLLDAVRKHDVRKFVYASSSSVYGNQRKTPFSETDNVDSPISPYAATKKAGEEMCYTYSHLYGISVTCLRFFTVYGPKGRPDMAPYLFTEAILKGKQIKRFGKGDSGRDYTYIDDIVDGVVAAVEHEAPYDIFNLGNGSPVLLNRFIETLEKITNKKAVIEELPKQEGDVDATFADIGKAKKLLGYNPKTSLEAGLREFVTWYTDHRLSNIRNV